MRRLFTFLFLINLLCISAFAANTEWKNGYIVSLTGDTIHGQVGIYDNGSNYHSCRFRSSLKGEITNYSPADISAYGTENGLVYSSLKVKSVNLDDTYFVQFLFNGIVNLYYIELPEDSVYSYILKRVDSERTVLMRTVEDSKSRPTAIKRIRITTATVLGDCPEIQDDIRKIKGNRDELIKLLEKYHHIVCDDIRCIIYAEKKPKRKHFIGPYAGIRHNEINHFYYWSTWTGNSVSPLIGLDYSTTVERFTDRWLIHATLDFSNLHINVNEGSYPKMKNQFSAFIVNNSLTMEYRILSLKVKPSFRFGFFQEGVFAYKNKIKVDRYPEEKYIYRKYWGGGQLDAAIYIPLNNRHEIPVRFTYQQGLFGQSLQAVNGFDMNFTFSLSVGYNFKL